VALASRKRAYTCQRHIASPGALDSTRRTCLPLDFLTEGGGYLAWWADGGFNLVVRITGMVGAWKPCQCVVTDDVGWAVESAQQGAQICSRTPFGSMARGVDSIPPANRTVVSPRGDALVLDKMNCMAAGRLPVSQRGKS